MDKNTQQELSPVLSPDSDSAIGTLSDLTPDEEVNIQYDQYENEILQEDAVDDDSDSESVVSASMQFTLTPATSNAQSMEEQDISEEMTSSSIDGVPILVKHEEVRVSTSPKKKIEDKILESTPEGIVINMSDVNESSSPSLPETVTFLTNNHGSKVYLIGTAHFSKESQEDVAKTIRMVRPDIVMVELCKSRTAVLQLDEETILNESQSLDFSKMCVIIRHHGKIQGILYLLLLSVSAHITKQLGMAPGGEFRTAFTEARRSVPGCLIQLGDRPIQITLSRALASLSVWQKMRLMWHIMVSKEPISKEEIEKCKQTDFIEEMLAELTGQFPAISEVFVKERDVYLTKSLQTAAEPIPNIRSPTGLSPRTVVGVVGIGHVPGIVAHWGKVSDDDIPPIMRIPPPNVSDQVVKFCFKLTFYGLIGFGIYKCLPKTAKASLYSSAENGVASLYKYISH